MRRTLSGVWWSALAMPLVIGCAAPRAAYVGQPFGIDHGAARVSGRVCGMDVEYAVESDQLRHALLGGFLDGRLPTRLEARDLGGERVITGSLGTAAGDAAVDLRVRPDRLTGRVGIRLFDLHAEGDRLVGTLKIANTYETTPAVINGRTAMWSMPLADQATVLPNLLTCYVARIGDYGRSPLVVGFGGARGDQPARSSALYTERSPR